MVQLSESELQTYEALYKHIGARILFDCDKVTYRGIIDMILPNIYQVKLRHTVIVQGDHYLGNLRFKFHEISSFKVVESSESVNRYPRNDYLLNILKNDQPVSKEIMAKATYGDELSDESDDDSAGDSEIEEKFVLDLPRHLQNSLPKDYIQIDSVNSDFYEAIQCIGTQQIIGVSFHGSVISRFGKIAWICISTDISSYIFDMRQLGKDAFDNGLKEIFETKSIKKVIHDSRYPSDCLAYQYSTCLSNVFDTQIADFVISMQKYSEKYKFHSFASLDCLLRNYLKVPQEFIFERETDKSRFNQAAISTKKSISNAYLYDLLKSVVYLRLLQKELAKELLGPFSKATEFYRTVLSKSSSWLIDFLGSDLSRPDQIPPGIIMNGIQTVYFQKPVIEQDISLMCTFVNPQNGKVITPTLGSSAYVKASLFRNLNKKKQEEKMQSLQRNVMDESCSKSKEKMNPLSSNGDSQTSSSQIESVGRGTDSMSFSTKPSFRHLDEVYHKLVNQMSTNQLEDVTNAKPPVNYTSTFVVKQLIAPWSNNNCNSSVNVSSKHSVNNVSDSSDYSSHSNKAEISESNDIWLKLRAKIAAERANSSSADYGQRKIKFVPG